MSERSTREVIEDHLRLRAAGDLEADLARNYSPDVVVMSHEGISRGHNGVRTLAGILSWYVPDSEYGYRHVVIADRFGMLEWTGQGPDRWVHDGADCYVVEHGRIVAQSIHYSSKQRRPHEQKRSAEMGTASPQHQNPR